MMLAQWTQLGWAVGLFAASLVISLAVVGVLLVKLPATYFLDSHLRQLPMDYHPVLRWTALIVKNVAGVLVVVFGLLLSIPGIPGQGLLTILVGVMLLNFPGKRRLERRILRVKLIYRNVNRLRRRYGKPPLLLESTSQTVS